MAKKKEEPAEKKQVNVCWLSGNYRQRSQIVKKVRDFLASKGPYEESIYGKEESFEYVYSQVVQRSCIEDTQRLIIINDWPVHKTTKETLYNHFVKMLDFVGSDLVIICNNLATESKKFLDGVQKVSKMYVFETEIKQWQAAGWVVSEMARREKDMTEGQAESLCQSVGTKENGYTYDLDKLYLACDKLNDYMGKRKNVTPEDIAAVCTDSSNFIIWSLYPLIDNRDFAGCMALINKGYEACKDIESFITDTLYSMIWRYRLLLFCKEGLAQQWDIPRISGEISELHKMKRTGEKFGIRCSIEVEKDSPPKPIYSQKVVEKIFESRVGKPPIACYNRKELYEILEAVELTLQKIRMGVNEAEAMLLLDAVLMTACNVADNELLSALRRIDYGRIY